MRKHWIAFKYGDNMVRRAGFYATSERHARNLMKRHHANSLDRRLKLHILRVSLDHKDIDDVVAGKFIQGKKHDPLRSQIKKLETKLFDLVDKKQATETDLSNFIAGSIEHDMRLRDLADLEARIKLKSSQIEILRTRL